MKRREFIRNTSAATAGMLLAATIPVWAAGRKTKLALVGTGHRGTGFWGRTIVDQFSDVVEYVGLCDSNPGRLEFARQRMGVNCPLFTDYDTMLSTVKPEVVIVTTVDADHHIFIVKALEAGANVITEKPMTTDETKCQAILDAEKRTGKKVTVAFNYRHGPHMLKIKELLAANRIGNLSSVDFNWMLNVYHGADYFRRWHGLMARSGSLWVHKATHHFDLLNWWLDSDPVEVTAQGSLEFYGKNNSFRGVRCRGCAHKDICKFYRDITKEEWLDQLYVKNEHYDGYFRDGCVWRNEIDIYDKMSAQIRYANGVLVNYSLTTYSPYEGWRIAFNGFNGRMETWQDIPYQDALVDQESRHAVEMSQNKDALPGKFRDIMVMDNFAKQHEVINVPQYAGGHGGGDKRMHNRIFRDPADNPHKILAGTRDGAMSLLVGVAARKSIEEKRMVRIAELTDIVPSVNRG